jgi:zinc protease
VNLMRRGAHTARLLSTSLLCAVGLLMGVGQAEALPRPETFTLKNGMEVLVIPDHRAPVVTQQVWYRVGASDEQRGKSGLAHFLEHLMFKGTKKIAVGEFSRTIARNGGVDNASTSYDYTNYYERIARDRLDLVMSMEADRMRGLQLEDPKTVLSERDVVAEERRQRTDNNPGARLAERMNAMLYPHHPYGTPVVGWMHEINALTPEDAINWYRTWYAPNNAILVLAGDVDVASVRPMVEKYFGKLKPTKNLPKREWAQDPPAEAPMRVSLADPKVRQPSFSRTYLSASYYTAKRDGIERGAEALDVLSEILGGTETSWIYRTLVEDKQLAVSAYSNADSSGLGGGSFSVGATPADGVTLEAVEAAMDAVIADFIKTGPSDAELARAKANLAASATYAVDDQEQLATIFGASLVTGETIDDVVNWETEVMKVTREDVIAAARRTLVIGRSVTGTLLPAPGEAQGGPPAPAAPPSSVVR